MKNLCMFLIAFLLVSQAINGQYSELKKKYDFQANTYYFQKSDPYNPFTAGVASFFIPGLGQMMSGETMRGICFLGGVTAILVTTFVVSLSYLEKPELESAPAGPIMAAGFVGALCIDIWSVCDAVKVAKIKNLALRDRGKTSFNLNITPYINPSDINLGHKSSLGISLNITF
jgi:hypothetical protein